MNQVFANRSEDDEIYPLTVSEIAEAQKANAEFKNCFKRNAVIVKDWKSSLLRTQNVSAKKEGWSYPSHSNGVR